MANEKKSEDLKGLLIPAGVLTGMGVGFLIGNVVAGMFIGLGIGFALLAFVAVFMPDRN